MAKTEKQITERQLIEDIKAKKFAPVYLITGDENYYIDLVSDYIEKNIIDESMRDFDQTVVYGRDVTMGNVIDMAMRYPMMSPVQVVIVKEAQDISGKDEWNLLAKYLENPQKQTVLVFCYRHKKMDKRSSAYKAIKDNGVVYEKNKIYDSEVPGWIASVVQQRGYSITQRGAMMMAESLGNNLDKIANELSKIYISVPVGSTIDEDIIERNVGISKDYNIFELQNAIGRRDIERCTRIVNYFIANPKEAPIPLLLASLYPFFIKIMLFHQEPDKSRAAAVLKVNPYFLGLYETAARNYSLGKLASCIGYLHETDLRSKGVRRSSNITDGDLIKELVFKIIH
ncbi:MAG: DNA polymerase III subunit delta [Bacteroidales bacterium]|nr:DNA polymerase III subunit delta [Bacteroidales bacterium]